MTDRTVPTEEMIVAGLEHYAEGGCAGLSEDERREAVWSILDAALAASPAAPGAEVEPVAWISRNALPVPKNALAIFAPVKREEYVVPLYLSPPTPDAIRAQARTEALDLVKAIAQDAYDECEMAVGPCSETGAYECSLERSGRDCLCMHGFSVAEALAERLEVAAGKPGEAEGWRPTHRHFKRGSTYRVVGEALAQVSTGAFNLAQYSRRIQDGSRLTIYQGQDGKLWARFTDEFNDGRFTPLEVEGGGDGE